MQQMMTAPAPSLTDLIEALEAAVRAADRERAMQLEQLILQRLATEASEHAAVERQVRALLAELDTPKTEPDRLDFEVLSIERSAAGWGEARTPARLLQGEVYPVWFGTNRKPDGQGGFGTQRHKLTTRGRAEVFIPESHRFGETGNPWWKRLLCFELADDNLRVKGVETQERDVFFAEINAAMQAARAGGEPPRALFFLHGFNVSFEDAAIRAAQIGYDLSVPGATAFFSWPSRGAVAAYPADEATIEASEQAITDFLVDFTANCGAEKVHVIAHSMGNRGLLRALQRIATNAETQGNVKFGQIFLAAPDVDRDLFLDLAHLYPQHGDRTTLYASDGDLPVHLSAKLHDAPRAGYYAPYTVAPGVDTVAVPDFDIDLLGHSYFAQAEALLHDIFDLMRHNEAPAQRQRIKPDEHEGVSFWKLKR
jgi:esterase/lipase superfamily enzyme